MSKTECTLSFPGTPRRRAHRHTGPIVAGVLVILLGAGLMLYPKLTDLRYLWAQWRLDVAAAAQTVLGGAGAGANHGGHDRLVSSGTQKGGVALPEGVVARIEIPAIGLQAYVLEGTGGSALARGPGHYPGTPLPGEPGNAAIAGHRTMYGHPFHDLDKLEPGDLIVTATLTTTATYRVSTIMVVDPRHTEVLAQGTPDRLTLTTCHPKGSAAKRLVVVAERTD